MPKFVQVVGVHGRELHFLYKCIAGEETSKTSENSPFQRLTHDTAFLNSALLTLNDTTRPY